MRRGIYGVIIVALSLLAISVSRVEAGPIIWDQSPAGLAAMYPGSSLYEASGNNSANYYYSSLVRFGSPTTVSAMSIYTESPQYRPASTTTATVRIWTVDPTSTPQMFTDVFTTGPAGPGITNQFGIPPFDFGLQEARVEFASPVQLLANTDYYFGMSGGDGDLAQWWIRDLPVNTVSCLYGGAYGSGSCYPVSDAIAFTLEGPAVPEPASLLLLGTGLAGLVRIARRRRP